jgi:hypothetical protein
MRHFTWGPGMALMLACVAGLTVAHRAAAEHQYGWDGKRHISYQHQKDLFYNYYAQPGPHCGAAASMYPAPLPVPPNVGHTYVTYQPFMPHEFLYAHHRSYYTYNPGAGWRRTNVHYGTRGLYWDNWIAQILPMRTNQTWAVHNDLHHPGLRW